MIAEFRYALPMLARLKASIKFWKFSQLSGRVITLVLCIGLERRDDAGYDGQKCHEGEEYQAEILNNDPDDSACTVMFVVNFHLCHFTLPPSSIFSLF